MTVRNSALFLRWLIVWASDAAGGDFRATTIDIWNDKEKKWASLAAKSTPWGIRLVLFTDMHTYVYAYKYIFM